VLFRADQPNRVAEPSADGGVDNRQRDARPARSLHDAVNELVVEVKRHFRSGTDLRRVVTNAAVTLEYSRKSENAEVGFGVVELGWVGTEELFQPSRRPSPRAIRRHVEPAETALPVDLFRARQTFGEIEIHDADIAPTQLVFGQRKVASPVGKDGQLSRDGVERDSWHNSSLHDYSHRYWRASELPASGILTEKQNGRE
jgi:hypothetical protein